MIMWKQTVFFVATSAVVYGVMCVYLIPSDIFISLIITLNKFSVGILQEQHAVVQLDLTDWLL